MSSKLSGSQSVNLSQSNGVSVIFFAFFTGSTNQSFFIYLVIIENQIRFNIQKS